MNCERFQTVVNDLARDQIMEAAERASALEHVAECDACALNWEDERSLTANLRTLADGMKLAATPPRLEARVLAAFREGGNAISVVKPVVEVIHTRRQLPRYWFAAIAALFLIVFGIFMVRARVQWRSQPLTSDGGVPLPTAPASAKQTPNDQRPAVPNATDPLPAAIDMPGRNEPRFQTVSNSPRGHRTKRTNVTENAAAPAADAKTDEIATGFFPLTYGRAPNFQEGGQLMRVELSRDAVARFGLPINMDRTNERVKADVLVGSDGLAQAIRFVH